MRKITLPSREVLSMSLEEALQNRRTNRLCKKDELDEKLLASVLWACAGITASDGKRTVPSARDFRVLSAYVLRADGVWFFNAEENALEQITDKDVREASTTHQPDFVKTAPISIIFVADHNRAPELPATTISVDAGAMGQSCYLASTALGLAGCIRASLDHEALRKAMQLPSNMEPVLAFTVGYPA